MLMGVHFVGTTAGVCNAGGHRDPHVRVPRVPPRRVLCGTGGELSKLDLHRGL
jgi:hypothetical protein